MQKNIVGSTTLMYAICYDLPIVDLILVKWM